MQIPLANLAVRCMLMMFTLYPARENWDRDTKKIAWVRDHMRKTGYLPVLHENNALIAAEFHESYCLFWFF
jgi:hypothetical protein